jgi:hypothetical protein
MLTTSDHKMLATKEKSARDHINRGFGYYLFMPARIGTTVAESTVTLAQYSAQASINRRRFSSKSPRRYAASTFCVRQRLFDNFILEVRTLGRPIAERAAKTVCG